MRKTIQRVVHATMDAEHLDEELSKDPVQKEKNREIFKPETQETLMSLD